MDPTEIITETVRFLLYEKYIIAEPSFGADVNGAEIEQLNAIASKCILSKFNGSRCLQTNNRTT